MVAKMGKDTPPTVTRSHEAIVGIIAGFAKTKPIADQRYGTSYQLISYPGREHPFLAMAIVRKSSTSGPGNRPIRALKYVSLSKLSKG